MIKNYKKNLKILKNNHVYSKEMEHDACGVGLVASTDGKKLRKIVEYGINALKAVFHRGAVDADGKTGDGAGIHLEIPSDFFSEKIALPATNISAPASIHNFEVSKFIPPSTSIKVFNFLLLINLLILLIFFN